MFWALSITSFTLLLMLGPLKEYRAPRNRPTNSTIREKGQNTTIRIAITVMGMDTSSSPLRRMMNWLLLPRVNIFLIQAHSLPSPSDTFALFSGVFHWALVSGFSWVVYSALVSPLLTLPSLSSSTSASSMSQSLASSAALASS